MLISIDRIAESREADSTSIQLTSLINAHTPIDAAAVWAKVRTALSRTALSRSEIL